MAFQKARKEYKCSFCGEVIAKGSHYECITMRPWDHPDNDGYGQWRLHKDCIDFWNDGYGAAGDFMEPDDCAEFKESLDKWKKGHNDN